MNNHTLISDKRWRPLRFAIVGGAATVTHLAVAGVLSYLGIPQSAYRINVTAFIIAFVVSYLGHKYITFGKSGSVVKFFIIALCGFALNNIILTCGLWLGGDAFLSIAIATVCVPVITYLASSIWAFK